MKIECRPISTYPVPETKSRRRPPFTVTPGRALDDLERELLHLGCRHAIIEADFRGSDIRQDGWPYANARASSPRVVLTLPNSKHGPLRYPCDTYTTWEGNVRAISLAPSALRAVDRYGVTRRGEQYTGWRALPASTEPTMTAQAAADLLSRFTLVTDPDRLLRDAAWAAQVVRRAIRQTHPDIGGSAEEFHQVQTARKVLAAHHGVAL